LDRCEIYFEIPLNPEISHRVYAVLAAGIFKDAYLFAVREANFATISWLRWSNTKYSPGAAPTSSSKRAFALSKSWAASIQRKLPSRSRRKISN
jgi:hypothetical protein